jgi:hypothetical protein
MQINKLLQNINQKFDAETQIEMSLTAVELSYLFSLVDTHLFSLDENTVDYKIFKSIFDKIEEGDIENKRTAIPFAVSI